MADVPLTVTIPSDIVANVKAATEKVHNGGESLTPAQAKTILQDEWRDHLKMMVANVESSEASNAQREIIEALLASWNGE